MLSLAACLDRRLATAGLPASIDSPSRGFLRHVLSDVMFTSAEALQSDVVVLATGDLKRKSQKRP